MDESILISEATVHISPPATLELVEAGPRPEDELTILRDKKLWEQDEGFEKVPEKNYVLAAIEGKSKEDIAGDILTDKEKAAKLHSELRVDDLTGLANAKGLRERTKAELIELGRKEGSFVVFVPDLNNMQSVNKVDHEKGNAYLQLFAGVANNALRPGDIAARVHGDEFVIVAPCDTPESALEIRKRLYQTMEDTVNALSPDHPLYSLRDSIKLQAAIGMSYQTWTQEELSILVSRDNEKISEMIGSKMTNATDQADTEMYEQKAIQKGKSQDGLKQNAIRKSDNKMLQDRHLWLVEDESVDIPTKDEIFADLVNKSQNQIADIIIEDKRRIRDLQEQLTIDEMTGLNNRNGFRRRVKEVVLELAREGKSFALMSGDVNEMKRLNDEFGHKAGDAAIVLVCQSVKDVIRGIDVGAHPYGDEEAVLLSDVTPEEAESIRQRIYDRQNELLSQLPEDHPLYKANKVLKLGGAFGISHRVLTPDEINAFKNANTKEEQGRFVMELVLDEVVKADINMHIEKRKIKEAQGEERIQK